MYITLQNVILQLCKLGFLLLCLQCYPSYLKFQILSGTKHLEKQYYTKVTKHKHLQGLKEQLQESSGAKSAVFDDHITAL